MATKSIRIFYRKSDGKQVWYHELRGSGVFPTTIEQDLADIPNKMPDGETSLGGILNNYGCIEERDAQKILDALDSDKNKVVNGELVIGAKRIVPPPQCPPGI